VQRFFCPPLAIYSAWFGPGSSKGNPLYLETDPAPPVIKASLPENETITANALKKMVLEKKDLRNQVNLDHADRGLVVLVYPGGHKVEEDRGIVIIHAGSNSQMFDLLQKVTREKEKGIGVLEIWCHGGPGYMRDLSEKGWMDGKDLGSKLKKLPWTNGGTIILTSCNVGLVKSKEGSFPQVLADASGKTVFVPMGYSPGTVCENTVNVVSWVYDDPERDIHDRWVCRKVGIPQMDNLPNRGDKTPIFGSQNDLYRKYTP
jgi:hypothetical protein